MLTISNLKASAIQPLIICHSVLFDLMNASDQIGINSYFPNIQISAFILNVISCDIFCI